MLDWSMIDLPASSRRQRGRDSGKTRVRRLNVRFAKPQDPVGCDRCRGLRVPDVDDESAVRLDGVARHQMIDALLCTHNKFKLTAWTDRVWSVRN